MIGRRGFLTGGAAAVALAAGAGVGIHQRVLPGRPYAAGFPRSVDVTARFAPGGHDPGYGRRVLPAQLAFLGTRIGHGAPGASLGAE
ncbi:twin-arginine translocation signal domain-containing protein [Nocardioides sp. SYSU D00038]|uniref:twin-arginine translocation signal domain-containing protein n=1 Tax=Nocardioides sp. SYSU D00038 TaxID=2812554 RepID=UPI00196810F3|nr:twin-arginine translocation signal domain-containing protein [Nocardioides sp. SYSU D00038]